MPSPRPSKRPRQLQDEPSPPPPSAKVPLPADAWVKILQYSDIDDVLACTAASKFHLREVAPIIKFLLVRTGESMDLTPAAVQRFRNVKAVLVYSYIKEIPARQGQDDCEDEYRLDEGTVKTVIPFLSALPTLKYFMLGGLSRHDHIMGWIAQGRVRFDNIDDSLIDGRDTWIQNELIESACEAYAQGKLSGEVVFDGLLPWAPVCHLRDFPGNADVHTCAYCERICNSLPPRLVMDLKNCNAPCISFANRLTIAQRRDSEAFVSFLTPLLRNKIAKMDAAVVLCPPDFSDVVHASEYYEIEYEYMRTLISKGADIKDPSIRKALVDVPKDVVGPHRFPHRFMNGKRIVLLEAYTKLKALGADINDSDFFIVDRSDRRTNYGLFVHQKIQTMCPESTREAKERLVSEKGVSIEDVEAEVKRALDRLDSSSPGLHWRWVHNCLERKLGIDLSGHHDATQALFYAEFWERYAWNFRDLIPQD